MSLTCIVHRQQFTAQYKIDKRGTYFICWIAAPIWQDQDGRSVYVVIRRLFLQPAHHDVRQLGIEPSCVPHKLKLSLSLFFISRKMKSRTVIRTDDAT